MFSNLSIYQIFLDIFQLSVLMMILTQWSPLSSDCLHNKSKKKNKATYSKQDKNALRSASFSCCCQPKINPKVMEIGKNISYHLCH